MVFDDVQHSFKSKYLRITFDRLPTFKKHIEKTTRKLNSRINTIQELVGTDWGVDTRILRTATLALVRVRAVVRARLK